MAEMESEQKKMGEENEERRSAPLTCEDAPVGEQNAQEKKSTRNTQLAIFFPSISSADQEEDRKKGKKSSSFSHPHQSHIHTVHYIPITIRKVKKLKKFLQK